MTAKTLTMKAETKTTRKLKDFRHVASSHSTRDVVVTPRLEHKDHRTRLLTPLPLLPCTHGSDTCGGSASCLSPSITKSSRRSYASTKVEHFKQKSHTSFTHLVSMQPCVENLSTRGKDALEVIEVRALDCAPWTDGQMDGQMDEQMDVGWTLDERCECLHISLRGCVLFALLALFTLPLFVVAGSSPCLPLLPPLLSMTEYFSLTTLIP